MAYFEQGGGEGFVPFNYEGAIGPFYIGVPAGFAEYEGYGGFCVPAPLGPPPPGPPVPPPPGPTFVPVTQGISPLDISDFVGRRLVAHIWNGSMICGFLRYAYPNGNLIFTEALQGSYHGPKLVLGKVDIPYGTYPLICAYYECGARFLFPLDNYIEVILPANH